MLISTAIDYGQKLGLLRKNKGLGGSSNRDLTVNWVVICGAVRLRIESIDGDLKWSSKFWCYARNPALVWWFKWTSFAILSESLCYFYSMLFGIERLDVWWNISVKILKWPYDRARLSGLALSHRDHDQCNVFDYKNYHMTAFRRFQMSTLSHFTLKKIMIGKHRNVRTR